MRNLLRRSLVLSLIVLLSLSAGKFSSSSLTAARVAQDSLPREPMGVYAKADIETVMNHEKAFKDCAKSPGCDIHVQFREFYARLLANPAISGLTIGQHWDHIQTAPDVYDFSFLDDAFIEANAANKSVMLIITPGVVSPAWLVDELPECLKNGVFLHDKCGKQAFEGFPEEIHVGNHKQLPLPWNEKYQDAWADFLGHLNDKYRSDPAFVSIAVAGPNCASVEMILPTQENVVKGVTQPSGLSVNDTWAALIKHAGLDAENPDQVFIDSWKKAIKTYEHIFSGVTLTLAADAGNALPEFDVTREDLIDLNLVPQDVAQLQQIDSDCSTTTTPLSCEAKTEVIWDFMNATCLRSPNCVNGKSTELGGLTAHNDQPGNIDIVGVKLLTSWPPPKKPPLPPLLGPPLLGGAEFDHPVSSNNTQQTGCPDYSNKTNPPTICPGLTVEEAAYNVMAVFFDNTPAAPYFKGTLMGFQKGTWGVAPMHYLEVPFLDVEYANENRCISNPSPTLGYMTLQQLLENASRDFLEIANGTLPMCEDEPLSVCDTTPPVTTAKLPAPTGLHGWYRGPVVMSFKASDDLSGVFSTELSLDNQLTWTPLGCSGLTLSGDGIYNVFARSTDLASHQETPILTTVKIDSTAPVTTVTTHLIRKISVVVTFAASDNLSGVARTEYSLDNGAHWQTGTAFPLTEDGLYTVLFRSIDVAGNIEKTNSIKLNVKI